MRAAPHGEPHGEIDDERGDDHKRGLVPPCHRFPLEDEDERHTEHRARDREQHEHAQDPAHPFGETMPCGLHSRSMAGTRDRGAG